MFSLNFKLNLLANISGGVTVLICCEYTSWVLKILVLPCGTLCTNVIALAFWNEVMPSPRILVYWVYKVEILGSYNNILSKYVPLPGPACWRRQKTMLLVSCSRWRRQMPTCNNQNKRIFWIVKQIVRKYGEGKFNQTWWAPTLKAVWRVWSIKSMYWLQVWLTLETS